jgi:DNA repair photolyase
MADVIFEEIECRTAIHRIHAGNMPFRWVVNPYRGSQSGCGYCAGEAPNGNSHARVIVKVNAPEMLRRDLGRPEWRRELVVIGAASDPYQAAELKYSLTHRLLRVMRDFANPVSIVTRSPHVVRDAGVLGELAEVADLTVTFAISTLDEDAFRRVEPGAPPPSERLRAMEVLAARGIRCGLLLAPVVPGVSDGPVELEGVVEAARQRGASFVHNNVLYLKPGTREWSMPLLREAYPHLAERHARYYRGPHGQRTYTQDVHRTIDALRSRYGLNSSDALARSTGQLQLAM